MTILKNKISTIFENQLPDFVIEDHPQFKELLKQYFIFLESGELTLTNIEATDQILLETQTSQNNFLILNATNEKGLDTNDRVVLEDTEYGEFQKGEIITGQTSNATATILADYLDEGGRLFISANNDFITGETVVGSTSGASAIVGKYRANPIQNIQQLLNYAKVDTTIFDYLNNFRDTFLNTIPNNLATGISKPKFIKRIKDLYRTKGTLEGHKIFFRALLNSESEIYLPKDDMLKVSDGKWSVEKIMRVTAVGDSQPLHLVGQTITQANIPGNGDVNLATAIVENVRQFRLGSEQISEIILNEDSISGTFVVGQNITATDNTDIDTLVTATIKGIITNTSINNDGSLYDESDTMTLTGGGNDANLQVGSVGTNGLSEIIVDNGGTGYAIGDDIVFDNTNTSGGGAIAKVSVVNGGFTQEDSTSTVDDHIVMEDETTRGDVYTGNKIVQESGTGVGDITDIRIVDTGHNYKTLPSLTISSSGGSNGTALAYGSEIGRVQSIKIIETGVNHNLSPSPPTLTFNTNLLLTSSTGNYAVGETVTSLDSSSSVITATVVSWSPSLKILKLKESTGTFEIDRVVTGGTSGVTGTVTKFDTATATTTVGSLLDTDGAYIGEDGFISENSKRIQDSLYYQDYSYVVRVNESINNWRDALKKTIHPSGFYVTGEVRIANRVNLQIQTPVVGLVSGIEETPLFVSLNTLFTTIFGRRLGTTTDGTSLRANPLAGVDPDFTESTVDHFTSNTRDVTLRSAMSFSLTTKPKLTVRDNLLNFGYAFAGPKLSTINKYAFNQVFTGAGPKVTIDQINSIRLMGTKNTSLDGEQVQLRDFTTDLKTNFAFPTEITFGGNNSFDETGVTFDVDTITFDVAS